MKNKFGLSWASWFIMNTIFLLPCLINAQNFSFKHFSVENGLAQSQVYAICQDTKGFLWMGTRGGGVCRFNGKEFRSFNKKNGLVSNMIDDLYVRRDTLFIATPDGICIFSKNEFKNIPSENEQLIGHFVELNQTLYWVTNKGLFSIANQALVQHDSNEWISGCAYQSKLILCSKKSMFEWKDGALHSIGHLDKADIQSAGVYNGKLMIGTYGGGVLAFEHDQWKPWHDECLNREIVLHFYQDRKNRLFISTMNNGVYVFDHNSSLQFQLKEGDGLCKNHIRCMLQDNEGNYWFGSSGNGISYYARNSFHHLNTSTGLPGNFIYSVFKDSQQRLWIGADARGITCIDHDSVIVFDANHHFGNYKVRAIVEDHEGNLFFGTEGYGAFVFENGEFKPLLASNRNYIRDLACNSKNELFMATADHGILKITKTIAGNYVSETMNEKNGLDDARISYLMVDKQDVLWFSTEKSGLYCYKNDRIQHVNQLKLHSPIRTLCEDENGVVWLATQTDGIMAIHKNGEPVVTDVNSFLTSTNIYQLACTSPHTLIIGTESGADQITLNSSQKVIRYKHFTHGDGFTGIETNLNALYVDPNGIFYSGTINGLEIYSGQIPHNEVVAPIPFFEEIKVNFEKVNWLSSSILQLKHSQNRIRFDFDANSLSNADQIGFSWRLNGYDEKWTPVSKEKSASYANLNPGNYVFEIKVCNQDNVWSKPIHISFYIAPVWWQKTWVRVLSVILFGLFFWSLYKLRVRQVKRKANRKLQDLRLQNELASLEHTALRLQMNPHFIFNAMNSIQSVIGHDGDKHARYYLAKFSKLMRQILNNSRKQEISLSEEIETLENYLLIEKFTNSISFEYRITCAEHIESDFIHIPPMVIQPFVENALKHGLRYLGSAQGCLEIEFNMEENELIIIIRDNGVGLTEARKRKEESKEPQHESVAIDVTNRRLQMLNPKNRIYIHEIIREERVVGTEVIIHIHLHS